MIEIDYYGERLIGCISGGQASRRRANQRLVRLTEKGRRAADGHRY